MLSSKPEFNPALKAWASGVFASIKDRVKATTAVDTTQFPVWGLVLIFCLAVGLMVYYFKAVRLFETAPNINRMAKADVQSQGGYGDANVNRKGIREYLGALKASGVPDTHLCLTNFYISTVNAGGLFFPAENGIVSPEAARTAVLAGARAFVFDIWPDLMPGAQFGPCLQVVESGSLWRRISMNSMSFASVLRPLIQEAFEIDARPGHEDPLILYLRFRGKPRTETLNRTANALTLLEPYRLDNSFNNRRGQANIFSMPIVELFRKVIIVSNITANGNVLSDYINIGPMEGIKDVWAPNDARGLGTEGVTDAKRKIMNNLTWVAPLSEDPVAEKNYDATPSHALGIHMCAMNLWNHNDLLKKTQTKEMFGVQSFAIKPEPLRYIIELLPVPKVPENPNWGSGTSAGTPLPARALQLP